MAFIKRPIIKAIIISALIVLPVLFLFLVSFARPLSTYPSQEGKTIARLNQMAEKYQAVVPDRYRFMSREWGYFCSLRVTDNQVEVGPGYARTGLLCVYKRKPHDNVPQDWIADSVITPLFSDMERLKVILISKDNNVTHIVRGLWDKTIEFFYCDNSDSLESVRDSIQTVKSGSIIRSGQADRFCWTIYPYNPNDRFE